MSYTLSSPRPRRRATAVAISVSIAFITAACGSADRGSPTDGTLTDAAYENSYFSFTLPLPEGWSVATPEVQEHFRDVGGKAIAGDDPGFKASLEAAMAKTYQLLTISEHPVGAAVETNPMILVMAENIAHAPGIQSGGDYLFHIWKALERSPLKYEPLGEASALDLGGKSFYRRDFELALPSGIRQSYIFTREGDYALGFVLTARDPDGVERLFGLVSKTRFD